MLVLAPLSHFLGKGSGFITFHKVIWNRYFEVQHLVTLFNIMGTYLLIFSGPWCYMDETVSRAYISSILGYLDTCQLFLSYIYGNKFIKKNLLKYNFSITFCITCSLEYIIVSFQELLCKEFIHSFFCWSFHLIHKLLIKKKFLINILLWRHEFLLFKLFHKPLSVAGFFCFFYLLFLYINSVIVLPAFLTCIFSFTAWSFYASGFGAAYAFIQPPI